MMLEAGFSSNHTDPLAVIKRSSNEHLEGHQFFWIVFFSKVPIIIVSPKREKGASTKIKKQTPPQTLLQEDLPPGQLADLGHQVGEPGIS